MIWPGNTSFSWARCFTHVGPVSKHHLRICTVFYSLSQVATSWRLARLRCCLSRLITKYLKTISKFMVLGETRLQMTAGFFFLFSYAHAYTHKKKSVLYHPLFELPFSSVLTLSSLSSQPWHQISSCDSYNNIGQPTLTSMIFFFFFSLLLFLFLTGGWNSCFVIAVQHNSLAYFKKRKRHAILLDKVATGILLVQEAVIDWSGHRQPSCTVPW